MFKPTTVPKKKIKDPNSRLTSDDIDNCESQEQLFEFKQYLELQMADADLKINNAKGKAASKGEFMEPDKYNRLLSYRRVLGFLHQRSIQKERMFNYQLKVDDVLPRIFMQCAKDALSPDEYETIYNKAKELAGV